MGGGERGFQSFVSPIQSSRAFNKTINLLTYVKQKRPSRNDKVEFVFGQKVNGKPYAINRKTSSRVHLGCGFNFVDITATSQHCRDINRPERQNFTGDAKFNII